MYYVYLLSFLGLVRQGQTSSVLDFRILFHTGNINYMTLLYSEMIPVVLLTVNTSYLLYLLGSKGGAVVRALASHHCGPGWTPGVDAICGLSQLLVLSLAPRGFSPGTPVFPSPQKPTFPNSNSIWNARTRLNEFIWSLMWFVGKQAI